MADLYQVPPTRNPGPLPTEEITFTPQTAVTAKLYADAFWQTDAKLTAKDRRDIAWELNRFCAYRFIGGVIGGFVFLMAGYRGSKRYMPTFVTSMTSLSALFGLQGGRSVGIIMSTAGTATDFSDRPECKKAILLTAYRPIMGLWISYFTNGKQGTHPLFDWWSQPSSLEALGPGYDDLAIDAEEAEREREFTQQTAPATATPFSVGGYSPTESSQNSWDAVRARAAGQDRVSRPHEPSRYGSKDPVQSSRGGGPKPLAAFQKTDNDARLDSMPEVESTAEFDRLIELERKGVDQADDFSQSETKFSKSKYD
ncbi:uncharacterized protein V1516DRAFT_682606 [Lipomyces oligophaga]|uniref:uncharacterized protein n=1 Tax=Lipomyces oligophaga TaxID=45792 RepID=UPI0034CF2F60